MHPAFALVHADQGAIEVAFEDAHLDVCGPTKRVGDGFGGTIEQHGFAVLVVAVDQSEGLGGESVKEHFLGGHVGVHGLVVVQMVPADIRKNGPGKRDARHALLDEPVGTHLHEDHLAPCGGHIGQVFLQNPSIGGGVRSRKFLAVNHNAHG